MIEQASRSLRQAAGIAAMTGSGISVASGIPTFRDPEEGMWAKVEPYQMATAEAFARDPEKVWQWYRWRRRKIEHSQPNRAHHLLAEWQSRLPMIGLTTQNVDGLHAEAGSTTVRELHGSIRRFICHLCRRELLLTAQQSDADAPPHCTHCQHGLARPAVVWFGEALPEDQFQAAYQDAQSCSVYLVIGTSGVVEPAASLARLAAEHGATVIEINPEPTALTTHANLSLQTDAVSALTEIDQLLHQ